MNVKVKICGIRSTESALAAVEAGADYLGFNFVASSKRSITPADAKKIIEKVRGKVKIVGIFKDSDIKKVNALALSLHLDLVQLHGNEDAQYINQVIPNIIKAISFPEGKDAVEISKDMYNYQANYFLVDREQQGKGKLVDRKKTQFLAQRFPVFLAGGLTPDNITAIIKEVQPYGVDVAGGIETDGREDLEKIRKFIKNAKGVTL